MSPKRRVQLLGLIAPALLVAVALGQLVLAHTSDLTPWKGGGFGMFAAIDDRVLVVELDFGGSTHRVPAEEIDAVLDEAVIDRATAMPDDAALERVARPLLNASWEVDGQPMSAVEGARPEGVLVAVEEVAFDRATDEAWRERLAERQVAP